MPCGRPGQGARRPGRQACQGASQARAQARTGGSATQDQRATEGQQATQDPQGKVSEPHLAAGPARVQADQADKQVKGQASPGLKPAQAGEPRKTGERHEASNPLKYSK
jgi:hypothetical protein